MANKTIIELTQFETGESIWINPKTIKRIQRYKDQAYTRILVDNAPEVNVVQTPQEIMTTANGEDTNYVAMNDKISVLDAAVKRAQTTADSAPQKADDAKTNSDKNNAALAKVKANNPLLKFDGVIL